MVESPHLDARHVALGDVGVEVREVALRDVEALVLGQHVEPLVVGEPPAHAHADGEARPFTSGERERAADGKRDDQSFHGFINLPVFSVQGCAGWTNRERGA